MAKQRSKSAKQPHKRSSLVSPLTSSIPDDARLGDDDDLREQVGADDDGGEDIPTRSSDSSQRKSDRSRTQMSSSGGGRRDGNQNRASSTRGIKTMSESKLMEEAALTALLFGGRDDEMGARSALSAMTASTAAFGDNDGATGTDTWAAQNEATWAKDEDLFAIDRSGEEILADEENRNDNADADEHELDEEDGDGTDSNRDYDDDEESMMHGKLEEGGSNNKAMMTSAAWRDSDSEEESHNSDDDEGDHSSIEEDDVAEGDDEDSDAHANRRSKKQKKGVSLVHGPNRLKKLRRYADETNPISVKEYELRLRERFITTASVAARTDWADVGLAKQLQDQQHGDDNEDETLGKRQKKKRGEYASSDSDDDDDDAAEQILESNASLFDTSTGRGGRRALPPTILDVLRSRDGNLQDPNNSVVSATQFHPNSDENNPLLMTAGLDKMLRFFRIGDGDEGETHSKIHGIHLPKLPITCASFLGSGELASSVILSGRRPFFYVYDAVSGNIQKIASISGRAERSLEKFRVSPDGRVIAFVGNDGYVILVDGKTRQWIGEVKMNGSVRALTFTEDSEYILGSGSDGDVYR